MEQDKKWYLIRLGDQSSTFQLKNGITTIGRNKKADVITISDICSRSHCTITWNANELTIKNLVSSRHLLFIHIIFFLNFQFKIVR